MAEIKEKVKEQKKVESLILNTVSEAASIIDVNTVIGKPILTASGFQVIPFTKVVYGNISGEGEYGESKVLKEAGEFPQVGGSGNVVSLKPCGFLVDDGKTCKLLKISDEPLDNLIDKAEQLFSRYMPEKDKK